MRPSIRSIELTISSARRRTEAARYGCPWAVTVDGLARGASRTLARHRRHDRGGIRVFDHGCLHEAAVGPLRAAAGVVHALPVVPAVFGVDDRLAALMV